MFFTLRGQAMARLVSLSHRRANSATKSTLWRNSLPRDTESSARRIPIVPRAICSSKRFASGIQFCFIISIFIRVAPIFGGAQNKFEQFKMLKGGCEIVVCTPVRSLGGSLTDRLVSRASVLLFSSNALAHIFPTRESHHHALRAA